MSQVTLHGLVEKYNVSQKNAASFFRVALLLSLDYYLQKYTASFNKDVAETVTLLI
jgi:hypothetical protein